MNNTSNFFGCRETSDDFCVDLKQDDLLNTIERANHAIAKYGKGVVEKILWGYSFPVVSKEDYTKLVIYRGALKRYRQDLITESRGCLKPSEAKYMAERVSILSDKANCPKKYSTLESDYTNVDTDDICVAYEAWEKAMFVKMPQVIAKVELKECLKFVYDLKVSLEKDYVFKILHDISVEQKAACDINYNVKVSTQDCKFEYNVISQKQSCDIDFDLYVNLRECGLSYDLISELVECGISPRYNEKDQTIYFETLSGNTYDLNDLHSLDKIKFR